MKPESRAARPPWSALFLGLAAWLLIFQTTKEAQAQYALSIPFDPWQAQYEAFIYPVVSSNLALPNQARIQSGWGRGAARRSPDFNPLDSISWLDAYVTGQSASESGARERLGATTGGRYIPYHSFNRLYDSAYNRRYTPNAEADQGYYEERQRREDLYLQSLSERDPQRRAELLRQLENANRAFRTELGTTTRRLPGESRAAASTSRGGVGTRRTPGSPVTTPSANRNASGIPSAPDALGSRPDANRAPGLPPSSLAQPRSGSGAPRTEALPSRTPDLGPDLRRVPGSDLDRGSAISDPSRRRGPASPSQPR